MAQATYSIDWDNLLSTTLNATEGVLYDNIFKGNPFLNKLLMADRVETEDGGAKLQRTIEYADGSNYQRVNGYTSIDLTPQEIITTAIDNWAEAVTTVSISRREERSNSGSHQLVNLLTAKMNNASKGFREGMATDILAPSGASQVAGTNACNPLVQLVPIIRSGSAENTTLHGINPTTATWWKPSTNGRVKSSSSNGTNITYTTFKNEIRRAVNGVRADSGEDPNLALGGQLAWEKYVESLEGQVRYASTDNADMGFRTVVVEGMDFIWDRKMIRVDANAQNTVNYTDTTATNEEVIYFLNTDYLYLIFDSESKFKSMGWTQSQNQLARSSIIVCMSQLMTTNRRAHGALYGIDTAGNTWS